MYYGFTPIHRDPRPRAREWARLKCEEDRGVFYSYNSSRSRTGRGGRGPGISAIPRAFVATTRTHSFDFGGARFIGHRTHDPTSARRAARFDSRIAVKQLRNSLKAVRVSRPYRAPRARIFSLVTNISVKCCCFQVGTKVVTDRYKVPGSGSITQLVEPLTGAQSLFLSQSSVCLLRCVRILHMDAMETL